MSKRSSPTRGICNGVFSFVILILIASLVAFTHFRLLYYLDVCESVIEASEDNIRPQEGTGIANYLSCMPQEAMSYAATLGYKFSLEYQKVIILANNQL